MSSGKLAVVTAWFNPSRSKNRQGCFRRFAAEMERQGVDLFVSEAVPAGELPEHDGNNVFYFTAEDTLWHKERLINLAVERLPDCYDSVAWVDADLLWDCDDLRDRTLDALTRWPVVQMFERAFFLDSADRPMTWNGHGETTTIGVAAKNRWTPSGAKSADPRYSHPGFAWAARRDVLTQIGGLYDRDMGGGGDTLIAMGWYGDFDSPYFRRLNNPIIEYAQQRLMRAFEVVRGKVGFVPCTIRHLYHGGLHNRQYWQRVLWLSDHGYDPAVHVTAADGELYQWAAEVPAEIPSWLERYLRGGRREDDVVGPGNRSALTTV